MNINLPLSFREVVDEIVRHTDLETDQVEHRVWMEALMSGYNVVRQARELGVTPHVFDPAMERLYREADGFIFETMTFWASPIRLTWLQQALERIQAYASAHAIEADQVRILLFGDGSGNDTLFFASHGMNVDYFDMPGSKTYDFATRRFAHHGVLGGPVRVLNDLGACKPASYDVVMSFEVLEHLTDPMAAIKDLARMAKPGGIALITESFAVVSGTLPTHLASNLEFDGKTVEMFARAGMTLTFDSALTPRKPMEFTRTTSHVVRDLLKASWDRAQALGLGGKRFTRLHRPRP